MRASSSSSSLLASLLKIVSGLLLLQAFLNCASAYPFRPSSDIATSLASRDNADAPLALPALRKRETATGGDVPGVDEIVEQIKAWGVVGALPSVFYTEHPMDLSIARKWASCFFGETNPPTPKAEYKYAIWFRLTDKKYFADSLATIRANVPDGVSEEDNLFYDDMFQKHVAQAFAEVSAGDVYLAVADNVVTDDRGWDTNKAFGGWEWPALTRNPNVENIYRIDANDASNTEPRLMWTKSDGEQGDEPKGIRGSTKQVPRKN